MNEKNVLSGFQKRKTNKIDNIKTYVNCIYVSKTEIEGEKIKFLFTKYKYMNNFINYF